MSCVAIIPARGGSKGVLGKNLKHLAGKPLIQHTIEAAQDSKKVTDICVTSDSPEILSLAEKLGAIPIIRPKELAEDHSLVLDAIQHALSELSSRNMNYSVATLLEATSPFKTGPLIDQCIDSFINAGGKASVATFCENEISPHRLWKIDGNMVSTFVSGAIPWLPRQKQPVAYRLNGLVYVFPTDFESIERIPKSFLTEKIIPVISKAEDSVDIDSEFDFAIADAIANWREK